MASIYSFHHVKKAIRNPLAVTKSIFQKNTMIRKNLQYMCMSTDRIESNGVSLDTNLIASNPDLVISHLKSRRSNQALLDDMMKISDLRTKRNALIKEGDAAKSERKALSKQIGMLMRDNKEDEVAVLKQKVEEATSTSDSIDVKLAAVDMEINALFSVIPNLLDDSVPDGDDEASVVGIAVVVYEGTDDSVTP